MMRPAPSHVHYANVGLQFKLSFNPSLAQLKATVLRDAPRGLDLFFRATARDARNSRGRDVTRGPRPRLTR